MRLAQYSCVGEISSRDPNEGSQELGSKHVDILVVCETKLNEAFPNSQSNMDDFSLVYRLDRNRNGRGVMIFVKEDILSKLLSKYNFPNFFNCIDKALDTYSNYDNVLFAGDFNAKDDEPWLSTFLLLDKHM